MGCVSQTDVYTTNQCGGYPSCSGFCSRFEYYTYRCRDLQGIYCTERDVPVPYTHYKYYCSPSWGYGCVCNSTPYYSSSGTTNYPSCR